MNRIELRPNTLVISILLVILGAGGAFALSSVPPIAGGIFVSCLLVAALVTWAGKRAIILLVEGDQLTYGGIFNKKITRSDIGSIRFDNGLHIERLDGRVITIQGFDPTALNLAAERLVDWPRTGRIGPSAVEIMMAQQAIGQLSDVVEEVEERRKL